MGLLWGKGLYGDLMSLYIYICTEYHVGICYWYLLVIKFQCSHM